MRLTALAGGTDQGADAAGHRDAAAGVVDHAAVVGLYDAESAGVARGVDVDIARIDHTAGTIGI